MSGGGGGGGGGAASRAASGLGHAGRPKSKSHLKPAELLLGILQAALLKVRLESLKCLLHSISR